ncbi:hypothetical protein EYF80_051030 [Liparis tanakae]|uniref:Uncharacterized protein n=1 Tax=Liparis tanakae TaxID=230148 RepID=A0A4Z2FDG0_9TELE|nr:hypothetical protein EYF80_051030 [Liparis tanakae]
MTQHADEAVVVDREDRPAGGLWKRHSLVSLRYGFLLAGSLRSISSVKDEAPISRSMMSKWLTRLVGLMLSEQQQVQLSVKAE